VIVGDAGLARFHALGAEEAEQALMACCSCASWARTVAAGRPYSDRAALQLAAMAALGTLSWAQVSQALDAHPRIGERAGLGGVEAAWSRQEQSAMDTANASMRHELAEANRAYEMRFGHIFLIAAAGRSDAEMLAAARQRLGHTDAVEREVVRAELAAIAAQRVQRLLDA
jgi:2-oxo-4-hydroxy-4-carboxy-5-ureidoimidazoline decarboxylase